MHKSEIKELIVKYWDCFCQKGACRPILDYEFTIDTGASKPVFYKKPTYSPHERPILLEHIKSLLANDWIEERGCAWGSMIVLVAKPYQEHINDIKYFIWRMYVSYRVLIRLLNISNIPYQYLMTLLTYFKWGRD